MFGISIYEFLFISIVSFLIIGPNNFASVLRSTLKTVMRIKMTLQSFLNHEAILNVKKEVNDIEKEIEDEFHETIVHTKNIIGDDGKAYEAYDLDKVFATKNQHTSHNSNESQSSSGDPKPNEESNDTT